MSAPAPAAPAWRDDPVPRDWRGLWRRVALQRADGTGDIDSLVLWLQTDTLFVDLRIPADRPAVTAFSPDLARQEGFAGRLLHNGDLARWERRIDYRPLGTPDEGRLARERRMMVEHGLHAPYVEHWWLEADGDDTEVLMDTPNAIAVRAGDHLMAAVERRPPVPDDLIARASTARDLGPLLDCEILHARRSEEGWRITASTLPWREGLVLTARGLLEIARS